MSLQKWLLFTASVVTWLSATTAKAAIIVTATPNSGGVNLQSGAATPAGTVLSTFDAVAIGSQPPGFTPVTGSVPGGGVASGNPSLYAAPLGDSTPFYAVARNPGAG